LYKDRFSGLYDTQYREYDPVHGRWLSPAPAGYRDGLNLYAAYMGVNGIDPLGLDKLIMEAIFNIKNNLVRIVNARAIFHEDEFTIPNPLLITPFAPFIINAYLNHLEFLGGLGLNNDYEVDIPGKFEFKADGLFYNNGGNIITVGELIQMAKDGGAQTPDKWRARIKEKATQLPQNWGAINSQIANPDSLVNLTMNAGGYTAYSKARLRER
jgi:hypothetical protein